MMLGLFWTFLFIVCAKVRGSSSDKPHNHQGVLEPYDGSLLKMIELSKEQLLKLDRGEAVVYNERNGQFGRGIVVHDIDASPSICMSKIRDLAMYPKMVPNLKKVEVYDSVTFNNGTTKEKAKFEIGAFGFNIGYYLHMTHEPKLNTLTWTLDYSRSSDIDDSVGHWQVMQHPKKSEWTRILYSTKIKLQAWVPEFFIQFMTSKALTEATGWLKREAEKEQLRLGRAVVQSHSSDSTSSSSGSTSNTANHTTSTTCSSRKSWFSMKGGSSDDNSRRASTGSALLSERLHSDSSVYNCNNNKPRGSKYVSSSGMHHFRLLNAARFKRV